MPKIRKLFAENRGRTSTEPLCLDWLQILAKNSTKAENVRQKRDRNNSKLLVKVTKSFQILLRDTIEKTYRKTFMEKLIQLDNYKQNPGNFKVK